MTRTYSGVIKLTACLDEGSCEAVKMCGIKKKEESNIVIIVIFKGILVHCEVIKFRSAVNEDRRFIISSNGILKQCLRGSGKLLILKLSSVISFHFSPFIPLIFH